jgi:alkyl hydroperoxide reductase subunit AhpF
MSMIQTRDADLIREHLAKNLKGPVGIEFFTQKDSPLSVPLQACMFCRETGDLLTELSVLSDRLTLKVNDIVTDTLRAKDLGITRIPAVVLTGAARGKVRFLGIPSGYEFAALLEDLVDVSRGVTDLPAGIREELATLQKDVHIQVFSTPT